MKNITAPTKDRAAQKSIEGYIPTFAIINPPKRLPATADTAPTQEFDMVRAVVVIFLGVMVDI